MLRTLNAGIVLESAEPGAFLHHQTVPLSSSSTITSKHLPISKTSRSPNPGQPHLFNTTYIVCAHVPVSTETAAAWLPTTTTAITATHDRERALGHARRPPGRTNTTQPLETV